MRYEGQKPVRKLYAVSGGSYSDYGVEAIFDTREAASKWASELEAAMEARWGWGTSRRPWYFVEEFDFYEGDELPAVPPWATIAP